jgi:pimeloyl-ACP methyl ester carboxylesterase
VRTLTRRRALWLSGVGAAVLFWVLAAIDLRMWDEGGPGIVGFELAGTEAAARDILAEWGPDGRDAARLSLWLDFPFLVLYAIFWALAALACRDLALRQGWERLARLGRPAAGAAVLAACADALEDVSLLVAIGEDGGAPAPAFAAGFAVVKFAALGLAELYVLVVIVRRVHAWSPRGFRVGVAALVGAGVLALALNTLLVERATAPAKADIGRIVSLPGGDVQVRVDGRPDAPPVVLVHGFGASMRWWDVVTPALARDLRVIRIDLLGHGGSEKPRDGYSMENQADIVAQAMDRLGVRGAPVAGHSMGGIVAAALAERHRDRVTRVMLIGTPPDDEVDDWNLTARLAFSPVTGHANDTLVTERIVRYVVEHGFAPDFDPPARLSRDIFGRTTWSSFDGSQEAIDRYWDERPLDRRLAATGVPLTVVLGERDRHARRSTAKYNAIGARTVVMQALDHSPQVEAPGRTAPLIAAFALGR